MTNQKTKGLTILLLIIMTFISLMPIMSVFQDDYKVSAFSATDLTFVDGKAVVTGFEGEGAAAWESVIGKYKEFIVGIGSVATVTFIIFFILNITKVAASATNPTARSQAIMGVIWTGIAAALLGSVTIWFGFFYNSLRGDAA